MTVQSLFRFFFENQYGLKRDQPTPGFRFQFASLGGNIGVPHIFLIINIKFLPFGYEPKVQKTNLLRLELGDYRFLLIKCIENYFLFYKSLESLLD